MLRISKSGRNRTLVLVAVLSTLVASAVAYAAAGGGSWTMGGHDISNSRSTTSSINPDNAKNLALKWKFTTEGDVSATPAVVDGAVYFPDWAGYMYKVDAATGSIIWKEKLSDLTHVDKQVSRTSPAVVGDTVYIGDQNGGHLIALNTADGSVRWTTDLGHGNPFMIETQAPIVYNGNVYVGLASSEEGAVAFIKDYPCCISRGSFSSVNAATGAINWQTYTVPPGYSGGGVWSSTAAVDPGSNTVYIATGNNYSVPDFVKQCEKNGGTPASCLAPDNLIDSIVALNLSSGAVRWSTGVQGFDDWNVACIISFFNPNGCPEQAGPDYDFGSGPNLFSLKTNGTNRLVVGAGQKSGEYWLLDAKTGQILWSSAAGPGSTLGGIEWGTATDGKRIFADESNYNHLPNHLPDGSTTTASAYVALDAATGATLWKVADPHGGVALGPMALANGVAYVGQLDGWMYALDANNGKVLWEFKGEGSSNAGPAITDKTIYWGNGYSHLGIPEGSASHSFYAFSVNGN